jgi:hypothetical protein
MSDAELYGDDACRASEQVNLHLFAHPDNIRGFVALRLADGGSDGVLYDSRKDAVVAKFPNEALYIYIQAQPGFTPKVAQRILEIHRQSYEAYKRLTSVDTPNLEIIIPQRIEDVLR